MANYLVVTIKSWNIANFNKLKAQDKKNKWFLITAKEDLTPEKIKEINPKYIFFPHWSWIIPKNIYENFNCIVFHMTDLPYGRGGSPLQNLIVRGHKDTKISAIKVVGQLDAGDIYLKKDLKLEGSAQKIFQRASLIIFKMMKFIVKTNPQPTAQTGKVVSFDRRKPDEGDISKLKELGKIYDYIRMLDGEGYPPAFLQLNDVRLEFDKAQLKDGEVIASVKIKIVK